MGFPLEGNQSLRVTGRLRARFFYFSVYKLYELFAYVKKKQ